MTAPRFTLAVCFHGFKPQCGPCLESLLAVRGQGVELLLVDDGSTDDTAARLAAFRDAHPDRSIRIVAHDRNLGLSAARNTAAAEARGDLLFFTSSDCAPDPEWARRLATCFDDAGIAAASGTTIDHPPRTLAEAAFTGATRIVPGGLQTRTLVGNNMAFRRAILLQHPFDPALRYYCDEDDLAWRLATTGRRLAFVADAVVHHDHPMTLRGYLRQAWHQGQGSARLWYKQGKYVGRDLLPFALALGTLPLGMVDRRLLAVPVLFAFAQLAALVYNQIAWKGKSMTLALKVLPIEVAHLACKTASVGATHARILLGLEPAIRASKQRWRATRVSPGSTSSGGT